MSQWIISEGNTRKLQAFCEEHTPVTMSFNDEPDYLLDCIPIKFNSSECTVIVDEYNNRYGLRPGMEVVVELDTIEAVAVRDRATVPPEDYRPTTDEEREAFRQDMLAAIDEGRFHAWALFLDPAEDEETQQIHDIVLHMDAFLRTDDIGFADTHLQVSNNPEGSEPEWHRTEDGYRIVLCAESSQHWCQVAFQLGYVMMHCLIDHLRPDEEYRIDWVEELICETASRHLLFELCRNWRGNPLSAKDPDYENALWSYLEEALNDHGDARLSACGSIEELKRINALGIRQPEARMEEVYNLYHRIYDGDIQRLAQCRRYAIPGTVLLNTERWLADEPESSAVAYLCRLQDRIPNTEKQCGTHAFLHMEESLPTAAQLDAICDYLLSLRDISGDNMVIQLAHDDCEKPSSGLRFIQACRSGSREKPFRVEVGMDDEAGYRILAEKETSAEKAMNFIRYACLRRSLPEAENWEDICKEVLREGEET